VSPSKGSIPLHKMSIPQSYLDGAPDASEELREEQGHHCRLLEHALHIGQPSNVIPPAA
jgi:hypothetical protein